jgi:hypothetical protein
MGRLIDADELKDYFKKLTCSEGADAAYRAGVNDSICNLLPKIVDSRPTVDAVPVIHAHWIRKYDTLFQNPSSSQNWYFVCSKCRGADRNRAKRCRCCGAIMDEEEENNGQAD